ncbi:MAG TPA: zinc-finger domain-containing protein [Sphingomonadales bacterium]
MVIEAPEKIYVQSRHLSCDGGEGALGHPRVYLNMGEDSQVECPYCDRLFILDEKAGQEGHKHA